MRRAALVVLLGCSCRALLGIDDPIVQDTAGDGSAIDAAVDGAGSATLCLGDAAVLQVCVPLPAQPRQFSKQTIETGVTVGSGSGSGGDDCDFVQTVGTLELCVIAGTAVSFDNVIVRDVGGTRPLVVVATESITIDDAFDAASHRGGTTGPGAATGSCAVGSAGGAPTGAGGGAGGSYGNAGGNGGAGTTGAGGSASAASTLGGIQAGCPGGGGGAGVSSQPINSGASGGVVYLIAPVIDIAGALDVSGMSGGGGVSLGGGGGGGTGGFVGIDALASLSITGGIFANGGGGGGGAGVDGSGSSAPGTRGIDGGSAVAAGGRAGGVSGGSGGAGTNGTAQPAVDGRPANGPTGGGSGSGSGSGSSTPPGAGGGGGGGLGVVWLVGSNAPLGMGVIDAVVVAKP
nr:hypothetical protein [Kofleriaceae bacterium]